MLPVIIEDLIRKLTDTSVHKEQRQFYYSTLVMIRKQIDRAIAIYEKEVTTIDEDSTNQRHSLWRKE
jgi:hypothetical protein